MTTIDLHQLALTLNDGQMPRVWSLLVTVFGDLSQSSTAAVTGADLRKVMDVIGIRPEAMRVALHRLRNEGWIESSKTGRNSTYKLTEMGREESKVASHMIYGAHPPAARAWLAVGPYIEATVALGPNLAITDTPSVSSDVMYFELVDPPSEWIRNQVCDDGLVERSVDLSRQLVALSEQLDAAAELGNVHRFALRVLVIHAWRRIALRIPQLPDHVFSSKWKGAECRRALAVILNGAGRPEVPFE